MFKEYDVRGEYPTVVSEEKFFFLGAALRHFSDGSDELFLGRDFRKSGNSLANAIASGFLQAGGREVKFLGTIPTPATAFLAGKLGCQVTASHNPPQYNGAKFFKEGRAFFSSELAKVKEAFESEAQKNAVKGALQKDVLGEVDEGEVKRYVEALPEFGTAVFDLCGGAACALKRLFNERIFDSPDPLFERHSAEPKDSTLGELKRKTGIEKKLGLAFDGDADRVIAVDCGKFIPGDVLAAFIAANFFRKGDKVVFSIDCANEVFESAKNAGLKPLWSGVGDVNVLKAAIDAKAAFAAETSGHYSFMRHMAYSDALYAAAKLSSVGSGEVAEFASQFKNTMIREEVFLRADFGKLGVLVRESQGFQSATTIDGIKAFFSDFVFLVRQSKTEPKIRISCEAENRENAEKGIALAKTLLEKTAIA